MWSGGATGRRLIAGVGLAIAAVGCRQEPALLRQAQKAVLVETLRGELLASVEAEKSAVMATTDQESTTFADESRRRTAELTRLRDELHRRITADGRPGEVEKLAAFDATFAELRDVDQRLLALAVVNSNLKAASLAAGESAETLDRLVDVLTEAQATTVDPAVLRRLSAAATAALRIQTLLPPHIAAADDATMSRLEARMRTLGDAVDAMLRETPSSAASAAWADYQRLMADVIRLSRLNTNVVSVDVSLNEKRRVTEACRGALDALLREIHAGPNPTR